MNAQKKNALGRGLNALLSDSSILNQKIESLVHPSPNIPIEKIECNPFQPRTTFEENALAELSESIKQQGIIQPITVRKLENGNFQLISGERRLRASKIAGLTEIPAYVREVDDNNMLELALVENIQRENLNSIEIALSYQRLIEECEFTQESLSDKLSISRSNVTNYLRLLKLPPNIQIAIRDNKISMGHARAIININDPKTQTNIFNQIIEKELSVRQVEELVRFANNAKKSKSSSKENLLSQEIENWRKTFSNKTNSKVKIKISPTGKGSIVIDFKNNDHLNNILKNI